MSRYSLIGCERSSDEFVVFLYDNIRKNTRRILAIDVLLHRRLPRQIELAEFRAIAWLAGAGYGMSSDAA